MNPLRKAFYFSFLLLLSCTSSEVKKRNNKIAHVGAKELIVTMPDSASNAKYFALEGSHVKAFKWTDATGDNFFFATETGEKISENEYGDTDVREAHLYAYQYRVIANDTILVWKATDFVKDCPVDITCAFYKDRFFITDLNKNGTAEVTFLYRTSCKGDVSPDDKKLLMYEGNRKYAIRGTAILEFPDRKIGGDKQIDKAFNSAPKEFLHFADSLWAETAVDKY